MSTYNVHPWLEGALQRSPSLLNAIETAMERVIAAPEGAAGAPVFADGFGSRFLGFDAEAGDPVEILVFEPALVAAPGFGSTVGVRVARVSGARHTLFARVRRIERPNPDSLLLVSDRVSGWRLADVLDVANRERITLDTSAVLNLLRQLIPAVALFGRHQRDLSVGTIAPERLILTPLGRLVLAEYVFGEAIERLSLEPPDLWRTFRITDSALTGNPHDPSRTDALGIGVVALSLLLGRRLRDEEFPQALGDLLELATENHGGDSRPLSPGLASWLSRALQLPGHRGLSSPKEAQVAFEELLATESGYVTSSAQLDGFIERFRTFAGPPAEPVRPLEQTASPAVSHAAGLTVESERTVFEAEAPLTQESAATASEFSWVPQPQQSYWEPLVPEPVTIPPPPVAPLVERSTRADFGYAFQADPPGAALETAVTQTTPLEHSLPPPDAEAAAASDQSEPEPEAASQRDHQLSAVAQPDALSADVEPSYEDERAADAESPAMQTTEEPGFAVAPAASSPLAAPPAPAAPWLTKAAAGLALLVVIETAAIAWLWSRSSAALLRDGELSVQSRPNAARVVVDDDDLGVTPLTVRLKPGTYSVKVQLGNAEPRVIVVQIKPGVQTAQYLELQTGR